MRTRDSNRRGSVWPELCFATAVSSIFFLLFPRVAQLAFSVIYPGNWSRQLWLALTIAFLVVLICVRFAPVVFDVWRTRREHLSAKRQKLEKERILREERETLERLQ